MDVGQRIKDLRQSKGVSREELADLINVSKFAIAKYEQGQREPKYDTLESIAKALNVPVYELMGSVDNLVNKAEKTLNDTYDKLGLSKDVKEMEKAINENDKIVYDKLLDLFETIIKQDNELYVKYNKLYGETPSQFLNTSYCEDTKSVLYNLVLMGAQGIASSMLRSLIKQANSKYLIEALDNKEGE